MITYYRTPDTWGSINIIGTIEEITPIVNDLSGILKRNVSIDECLKGYQEGKVIVFEEITKKWTQKYIYSLDGYYLGNQLIEKP